MLIFEVLSKLNKKIRLTEIQWAHIESKHKELKNQIQKMIATLENPDFVYYSPTEENFHYYKRFEETPVTEKYLLMVAKHLNDDGFIITAFFVSKIKKEGKEVIYGEENIHKL
ncbi:MAG: PBECR2 nuclease fold domain-containing protein [Nitrospirota bacterium]